MHSENIAAYIGLDVHKETLAVAIAAPERHYFRNCRDFTETFFPAMRLAPVVLGYIINSQR